MSSLEAVGPFETQRIVVDGYEVPSLTGMLKDGRWHFTFDNRFGLDVPEIDGLAVAVFIANVMAVSAGYSCFGENSRPLNQFKRKLTRLDFAVEQSCGIQESAGENIQ